MLIIPANSASATGGYAVDNSCRFASASSYMHKTPGGAGNLQTYTISSWVKRADISTTLGTLLLCSYTNASNYTNFYIGSGDKLTVNSYGTGSVCFIETNRLFRDASAWYHIVIAVDTTQGTASDRVKIYVNGVRETSFASTTYFGSSVNTLINSTVSTNINRNQYGTVQGSSYMSEICLIDGTALTPTDFGEFDEDSGIWKPIDVSGLTFGTNGFYLDFEDSANLGNDANGGTDFTEVNLAAIDQSTDTCTNNFCTMNPLDTYNSPTITDGNTICNAGGSDKSMRSTIGISSGKWYWEVNTTANNSANMGIINGEAVLTDGNSLQSVSTNSVIWEGNGGLLFKNGSSVTTAYSGGTATYGFAFDLDAGTLKLSKDGVFYNSGTAVVTGITADTYLPFFAPNGGGSPTEFKANFGNPAYAISSGNTDGNGYGNFEYAVPSGYYSLNTKNLAEYG